MLANRRGRVAAVVPMAGAPEPWAIVQLEHGMATAPIECAAGLAATLQPRQRVIVADVGPIPDAELVVIAALPPD